MLKYNPDWSGKRSTIQPITIPEIYNEKFALVYHSEYPLKVHFTREGWNGRMKSCRGIGASLTPDEIAPMPMSKTDSEELQARAAMTLKIGSTALVFNAQSRK